MKLSYRGVSYDYNPSVVETTTDEVGGKYRGLDWRFRNLKKAPVLQPTANLKYRGVAYSKPGTIVENTSTQEKARRLMIDRTKATTKRQQSMLSRSAAEIGLPAGI